MLGVEIEQRILAMAAEEKSVGQIASELAIHPNTVYARFRDPLFAAKLAERKGKKLARSAFRASRLVDTCLDVLEAYIDGRTPTDDKNRLTAIKTAMDLGFKLRQESTYVHRIAALEAAVAGSGIELPVTDQQELNEPEDD